MYNKQVPSLSNLYESIAYIKANLSDMQFLR